MTVFGIILTVITVTAVAAAGVVMVICADRERRLGDRDVMDSRRRP